MDRYWCMWTTNYSETKEQVMRKFKMTKITYCMPLYHKYTESTHTASQAWISEAKQNDLVWPKITFHAARCLVAKWRKREREWGILYGMLNIINIKPTANQLKITFFFFSLLEISCVPRKAILNFIVLEKDETTTLRFKEYAKYCV